MALLLARITAPHFVCGIELDTHTTRVTRTAPIVAYMHNWPAARVHAYCQRKGWDVRRVQNRLALENPASDP